MPKNKRWRVEKDLHEYLGQLEEVYGIQVGLSFFQSPFLPANEQYTKLAFWWNGEDRDKVEPVAYMVYPTCKWPAEKVGPSLLAAASRFTYLVIEAHCEALTVTDLRRN